ncbi:MAG: hypothetical protein Q7T57_07125 [Dehalococcoidales bacterium]|nr:hypothetical protein [Dehalococcoidales bacterium]
MVQADVTLLSTDPFFDCPLMHLRLPTFDQVFARVQMVHTKEAALALDTRLAQQETRLKTSFLLLRMLLLVRAFELQLVEEQSPTKAFPLVLPTTCDAKLIHLIAVTRTRLREFGQCVLQIDRHANTMHCMLHATAITLSFRVAPRC